LESDKDAIELYLSLERVTFKALILFNHYDEFFSQLPDGSIAFSPASGRTTQLSRKQQLAILEKKTLLRSIYGHCFEFHASLTVAKPDIFIRTKELLYEFRKSEKRLVGKSTIIISCM
jgi:hypothetical protein